MHPTPAPTPGPTTGPASGPATTGGASAPAGSGPARPSRVAFAPGSPNTAALDRVLTRLEDLERRERALAAERLTLLAAAHDIAASEATLVGGHGQVEASMAYRSVQAEIAAALHTGNVTAGRQLHHAHVITGSYPRVLDALTSGAISAAHTRVITDAGRVIGDSNVADSPADTERRARYEALVVEKAAGTSPAGLSPYARRVAEQYATVSLDDRYARARTHRMVTVTPLDDGMACLAAILPAHHAIAAASRLRALAKQLQAVEETTHRDATEHARVQGIDTPTEVRRTRSQIQADLVAELLLNTTTETTDPAISGMGGPVVRGIVQVITLQEHLDPRTSDVEGPAARAIAGARVPAPELASYGPIPVGVVREIAGNTPTWLNVTTNAAGAVSHIEPRFPSRAQRRHLIARDDTCRWVGCTMPAHHCDIDHTIAYTDGGATTVENLGHLCRNHHLLKHHGGWHLKQNAHGDYTLVSPTGRAYQTRPASRVRFTPVADPDSARDPSPEYQGTTPPSPSEHPPQSADEQQSTGEQQSTDEQHVINEQQSVNEQQFVNEQQATNEQQTTEEQQAVDKQRTAEEQPF